MAYGDDFASPTQRRVAAAAVLLAAFELACGWWAAVLMVAAPNPRLTAISVTLAVIIIANCVLMFGRKRAANHWLRIFSLAPIALMIGLPAALVLTAHGHSTS